MTRDGTFPNPIRTRMEEGEDIGPLPRRQPRPPAYTQRQPEGPEDTEPTFDPELIRLLMNERQSILTNERLATKDKIKLLESNRQALILAQGRSHSTTKSENVVYAILVFSGVMLSVLAVLTAKYNLPAEITIGFVGTTLGGTIATIAQKIGKV